MVGWLSSQYFGSLMPGTLRTGPQPVGVVAHINVAVRLEGRLPVSSWQVKVLVINGNGAATLIVFCFVKRAHRFTFAEHAGFVAAATINTFLHTIAGVNFVHAVAWMVRVK